MDGWGSAASVAVLVATLTGCGAPTPGTTAAAPGTVPASVPGLPPGARVDYQLGGAHPPAEGVDGVVRDRTDRPAAGLWSACYVNAFQTQPGGAATWPEELLLHDAAGHRVADPDWPDEFLLDISTAESRAAVLGVVGPWVDGCAADGFDAVEPDNLDSWTRSGGLLDVTDATAMAELLVQRAHRAGLTIAQKNAPDLTGAGLGFDFAVTEDCGQYAECAAYTDVHGGAVIDVEYTDAGFERACAVPGISVQRRDLLVSVAGSPGHRAAWCPPS
ncbi:endo alpha-1,4 polygalactosaminidase [Modestobacter marinus]|uniref:Glycoside-hydrolase family GH114 TIM-barrel domain-containing protein n=1 Tax=Modestobacter marinus TaxID=477641 RepID=A0A846LNU0_9ACTN|nr:endo alpha-1,4 polygalactosaminidase [Modestobacter marinus]NIH67862.1 hypothetical protein [Modestobacter marinus]